MFNLTHINYLINCTKVSRISPQILSTVILCYNSSMIIGCINKMKKNIAIYQALYAGFITIIIVGLYFWNFHEQFSEKISEWGDFGSYVGGAAGTFISLLNLWLIIRNNDRLTSIEEKKNIPFIVLGMSNSSISLKNIGLGVAIVNFKNYEWHKKYTSQIDDLYTKDRNITIDKDGYITTYNLKEKLIQIRDEFQLKYSLMHKGPLIIAPNESQIIFSVQLMCENSLTSNDDHIFQQFLKEVFKSNVILEYNVQDITSTKIGCATISIDGDNLYAKYDYSIAFDKPLIIETKI